MTTNDGLQASIAASLVFADLTLTSGVVTSPDGRQTRTFRLQYEILGQACLVTGYVGGAMLTVLAPIRLEVQPEELTAKRHQLFDYIVRRLPLVRLFAHPYERPAGDENVVWVEAAVPVPLNGQPIEPWLAVSPFAAVSGAVEHLAKTFPDVKPTTATTLPMLISERSEDPQSQAPPA